MRGFKVRGCLARPGQGVFLGKAGLRAGWRVAIFVVAAAAVLACAVAAATRIPVFVALAKQTRNGVLPPAFVLTNELFVLLPFVAATCLMALLEGRRVSAYGLAGRSKAKLFGAGAAVGVLSFALLVALLLGAGVNRLAPSGLPLAAALRYGVEWAVAITLIGFTEEFAFRGYLFATLQSGAGFWPAAVLTSLAFGAAHGVDAGETPVGLFAAAAIAVVLCLSVRATGSLWWAIGFHAAWDYAESFLFGANDSGQAFAGRLLALTPRGNVYLSGGKTGPEGSLLCLVVVAGLVFYVLRRRRKAVLF